MNDPHAICRKWFQRLGIGFHPDTRGADYEPAMSVKWVNEYEADMQTLFDTASDPYECAVMTLEGELQ